MLDKAIGSRLNHLDTALIDGDIARRLEHGAHPARLDLGRADAKILRDMAVDHDTVTAAAAAIPVRIHRHELHVHEGRLARLVEALAGHHGIMPVQDFLAGFRIGVARLERGRRAGQGRRLRRLR
ncbi:hypothetical protein D3C87_1807620 [compost metagenome]